MRLIIFSSLKFIEYTELISFPVYKWVPNTLFMLRILTEKEIIGDK